MTLPSSWRVRRTEIQIEVPATGDLEATLSLRKSAPRPSALVTIVERPAEASDLEHEIRLLMSQLARDVRGYKQVRESEQRFDDGACGRSVTISFEAGPGARALQRHVFRQDGATIIHLTATVDERRGGTLLAELDGELLHGLFDFRVLEHQRRMGRSDRASESFDREHF